MAGDDPDGAGCTVFVYVSVGWAEQEEKAMSAECYDRAGQPITVEQWAELSDDKAYKVVAQEQVGESLVSTVWLGLDHGCLGDGPPVIFETLVFGGPLADEMWRYTTEAQAWEGHAVMVGRVRNHKEGDDDDPHDES